MQMMKWFIFPVLALAVSAEPFDYHSVIGREQKEPSNRIEGELLQRGPRARP